VQRRHRVEVSEAAKHDLSQHFNYIGSGSVDAAKRWLSEMERRILSLERFPRRCPVIPEARKLGVEYRHLLYGAYRAIYRIEGPTVLVVRVLHGAQLLGKALLE